MRGSPISNSCAIVLSGIIPAHAGLTTRVFSFGHPSRDHPRACGAHQVNVAERDAFTGSSPRMRGSRDECPNVIRRRGIIPAHAGLTAAIE